MAAEFEHAGYKITYAENEGRWRCWDLDLDAPQLSTLKSKITAFLATERKLTPTPAVYWREYGDPEMITITMVVAAPAKAGNQDPAVWGTDSKGDRAKYRVRDLLVLDDALKAKIIEYRSLKKQVSALNEKMRPLRMNNTTVDIATLPKMEEVK